MSPTDHVHPVASALLTACLAVAIAVRVAFTHGFGSGFAMLMVGGLAAVFVYWAADMLSWSADDPRWGIVYPDDDEYRYP